MIVWRLTSTDPTIASTRYRAVLPALHLRKLGYVSRFSTRDEPLPNLLGVEALIFVKTFSEQDLKVARAARRRGIPAILDICDNIFVEGYSFFGAHPNTFRQMAAIASVIVTTGSELARFVRSETGNSTPVMIVPDAVETEVDREQIVCVLADWQLYSAAMRGYFRVRAQMREHGALLTTARALVRLGTVVAARADRIPGRPFRFITTSARTIFRSSRLAVRHARNLSQIVARRVREDGPQWVIRGVARRTRSLIERSFRFITTSARTIFRSSRLAVRHARNLSQIVARRIREDGPRWVMRGIVRRTCSLIERLRGVARVPLVAAEVSPFSEYPSAKDSCSANDGTSGKAAPGSTSSSVENGGDPEGASAKHILIWFGNHGGFYGQFGLEDLARLRPALCTIAERHPIRLIVVSNSDARFNDLIRPFPFSTQYVPWRSGVVEQLFQESEIALLPNSLDAFSVCKSANRAILALYHGVPVVATRTPALEPFAGCVIFDDWVGGIETYLREPGLAQHHVKVGQAIIEREFSAKCIAAKWHAILQAGLAECPRPAEESAG